MNVVSAVLAAGFAALAALWMAGLSRSVPRSERIVALGSMLLCLAAAIVLTLLALPPGILSDRVAAGLAAGGACVATVGTVINVAFFRMRLSRQRTKRGGSRGRTLS